jgi:glycosyltransferase involved in cell wall biosynthesis
MRKWDALSRRLDIRVVVETRASSTLADDRFVALSPFRLRLLRSVAFYARLPRVIHRELELFRPHVLITQGPFDAIPALFARKLGRAGGVPMIVEVHGDWRASSRLYGSRLRRLLAPVTDAAAVWAMRRADVVRAIGPAMSRIAKEATGKSPASVFPTYFEADAYFRTPPAGLPATPTALWVGTLQRTKNPELLARAWSVVARTLPEARLVVVGSGPLQPVIDQLQTTHPGRVDVFSHLEPDDLKHRFDSATALVLPSLSEGLGRVVIESFARGRAVIATRVGGIPDLVENDVNGLLVPSNDADALAAAIIRVLGDQKLAARLGRRARVDSEAHRWTTERYAQAVLDLVQDTVSQ